MPLSQLLLDLLACPKCHTKLVLSEDQTAVLCEKCRLRFRIEDDIPVMLIDEAEGY